ncbi:MAG: competence protein ComEA [Halieaceae bacterium]|jgi:competence protein ComEA
MTILTWIKWIFLSTLIASATPSLAQNPAVQIADATSVINVQAVNINVADAKTLSKALLGVGVVRANAIVNHRETYGPFSSVEDLRKVKGIGKSVVDKNRDRIILD